MGKSDRLGLPARVAARAVRATPAAVRGVLAARRRLLDLADQLLPAEVALSDVLWGLQRTNVAGVLVTSGLADAMYEQARTPSDLARELDLDPDVTERLLQGAAASRLVDFDRAGRARLTRLGAPLSSAHKRSIASWAAVNANPMAALGYRELGTQLREGAEPSGIRRATGQSLWEFFASHPEDGATFAAAMRETSGFDRGGIVYGYPWPERGVICDVAGGAGHLLASILDHRPAARGMLIDSPDVLAEAKTFLDSRGLADRIECRPGDLFGTLDARADVYILKWILHDWSDDSCRDILLRLRSTMPAGSRVVVIDQHREANAPNSFTPLLDLHMLALCEGGRERSPEEVHALFRDAGLKPGPVHHSGPQMLVEGVAP